MATHYDIARSWAKQDKPSRKNRSLFFEGDTIYSYGRHWPIAKLTTLGDTGNRIALANPDRYSPSTDRHTSHARSAVRFTSWTWTYVDTDLWDKVHDTPTLARAKYVTEERAKDRAYEARIERNKRARRDREHNADQARRELEALLNLDDLEDMSASFAARLRNLLLGVPTNNFQANRWYHSTRMGGLVTQYPAIVSFVSALLEEDPSRIKQPTLMFTLIENFKLLAA